MADFRSTIRMAFLTGSRRNVIVQQGTHVTVEKWIGLFHYSQLLYPGVFEIQGKKYSADSPTHSMSRAVFYVPEGPHILLCAANWLMAIFGSVHDENWTEHQPVHKDRWKIAL